MGGVRTPCKFCKHTMCSLQVEHTDPVTEQMIHDQKWPVVRDMVHMLAICPERYATNFIVNFLGRTAVASQNCMLTYSEQKLHVDVQRHLAELANLACQRVDFTPAPRLQVSGTPSETAS